MEEANEKTLGQLSEEMGFSQIDRDTEALRQLGCVRLFKGCAILDKRSIGRELDPRCLETIARELGATAPIALIVQSHSVEMDNYLIPTCAYTFQWLAHKPAAADLAKLDHILFELESERYSELGYPVAETLFAPEDVVSIALAWIADQNQ